MSMIHTPQILYHGTSTQHLNAFHTKLLDRTCWRPGTDFGEGLYTATSLKQAKNWARHTVNREGVISKPLVLVLKLVHVPDHFTPQIFLGLSLSWSDYIWAHRTVKQKGKDPCRRHADLIVGPVADNDVGKIVHEAMTLNKDRYWFYHQITRNKKGRKIDVSKLGHQVVFANELWEDYLKLVGYYIYTGGRWSYHEPTGKVKSI